MSRTVRSIVRDIRSPETGLIGQGVRFGMAGGTVAVVYLTTTTVLSDVVGILFQVALAIGFCVGVIVHFTLQRKFVWVHDGEFALPFHRQAARYLVVAAIQYALTAASTSLLPSAIGVPTEVVYLATVGLLVTVNFVVFRYRVFHPREPILDAGKY